MTHFQYSAIAANGQSLNGYAAAENLLDLDRVLEGRGLTLTSAKESKSKAGGGGKPFNSTELVFFTTQLATLLSAGVPILSGLAGVAKRMPTKHGRELVQRLVVRLEGGLGLTAALSEESNSFPEVYRACVRAGEVSGALPDILVRQSKFLEWSRAIRMTTMQALIYPAMLVLAILMLIVILLTFVLPRLMKLFPGGRDTLPMPTQIVMACSDFLMNNIALLGFGTFAVVGGLFFARKSADVRQWISKQVLRIPRYGKLAGMIATSRFASTAGTLQNAGCDIGTVLEVAGNTCGNAHMEHGFLQVAKEVRRGRTITECLEEIGGMDPLLIQMTHIGESSGDLSGSLGQLAEYYNAEVPRAVKWFLALLEPTILFVAGGIVAFILLATMLPILSIYDSVG
ncbi:MAG: type II secretion system F family protein [Planctomycetota bacterium]|nr:type II secretion system F family protein [Planctomycetota bacterium]